MPRLLFVLVAAHLALAPAPAFAADVAWDHWKTIAGIFDIDGPRTDGSIIVAGSAALYLVDPAGTVTPFARGPGGYHEDAGAEAYLAMSHGENVSAAGCSFTPDDTFLLRLHVPIGVNRVNAAGDESGSFANLTAGTVLNGIAIDITGDFDHRLLVTGLAGGKATVFAIDCNGAVQVITRSAPRVEGGLAVAPSSFGSFGGALIAPDEVSGTIYAITKTGAVKTVAKPSLPIGGDIGVESVGFVPPGFFGRGGEVYYADRLTRGNRHPGANGLLRLSSDQLATAGVQDGDLLAVTEGGATMVAVRCESSCMVIPVVTKATKAHGEGHLTFVLNPPPPPSPSPSTPSAAPLSVPPGTVQLIGDWGIPAAAVLVFLALFAGLGVRALRRRGR